MRSPSPSAQPISVTTVPSFLHPQDQMHPFPPAHLTTTYTHTSSSLRILNPESQTWPQGMQASWTLPSSHIFIPPLQTSETFSPSNIFSSPLGLPQPSFSFPFPFLPRPFLEYAVGIPSPQFLWGRYALARLALGTAYGHLCSSMNSSQMNNCTDLSYKPTCSMITPAFSTHKETDFQ